MNANSHHHLRLEYVAIGGFLSIACLFRRQTSGRYRVTCEDLPGMVAFGDTLDDARENAREELLIRLPGSELLQERFSSGLI